MVPCTSGTLPAAIGSVFILLVVLAAVTTQPFYSSSSSASTRGARAVGSADDSGTPSQGVWNEGGLSFEQLAEPGPDFVPCKGPDLQCQVVNKIPLPEVRAGDTLLRWPATS